LLKQNNKVKILVCNQFGIDLIKKFEGFKSNPYKCPAGVNTIGYGSTFYPDGSKVKLTDPAITEEKATDLLLDLLKPFQKSVDSFCRDDVNSNQFSALCSFCYNVGPNNLKGSTLLKKVNKDPNDLTIKDEFLKWNKSGGKTLTGLTIRRMAEAKLYFQS
jgi:lysozyme